MRRMRVALLVICLAAAAGCGGEERTGADTPAALAYVPRDAYLVAVVPTDLEGDQWRRLGRLVGPTLREDEGGGSLRDMIAESLEEGALSFERDIEPLLGGPLVIAASGTRDEPQVLAALETPDGDKAKAILAEVRKLTTATVDGDTLLLSLEGDGREIIEAAVKRREAGDSLDADTFADAFAEGAGDDALVRMMGDPRTLTRELDVDVELPWIQALLTASLTLRLDADEIVGELLVRTRPDGLRDEDLPLATGEEAPEAGDVPGTIAAANRDQSRTTVFLARLAREAYPDSRFVREVEAVEADLGISFEDAVLGQFNGPSASVATPGGDFAAVSDLADPDGMRALLPRLAPRLPAILHGLEGLGNSGLVALLLFAPDAPLVPGALPTLSADIAVRALGQAGDEQLYEISGLREDDRDFAVERVVFGLIDDRFVVATNVQQARAVAKMEVSEVDGAHGAAVARADVGTWLRDGIGIETVPLGEATGGLEASFEGLEGRLRVKVPGGLD